MLDGCSGKDVKEVTPVRDPGKLLHVSAKRSSHDKNSMQRSHLDVIKWEQPSRVLERNRREAIMNEDSWRILCRARTLKGALRNDSNANGH